MTETSTDNAAAANAYSSEITQLDEGRVLHFRLLYNSAPLSWSEVIDRWQNDPPFRVFFVSTLIDAPFPAYFWETPPVTSATVNAEFECVLVESPQLAGIRTDQHAFTNQFAVAQSDASAISFSNLGGDATLVVPCRSETLSDYSQISTFSRTAPAGNQHQLWALVGATLEQQLGTQPVWLSTSGLGVYWIHIRLDTEPKYYTHAPYRNCR